MSNIHARVGLAEARKLMSTNDLIGIGQRANALREKLNGNVTHFIVNRHINYTNVCLNGCRFCAFSKKKGVKGSYTMRMDEILRRAMLAKKEGATELHVVGGLHPDIPFGFYLDMMSELHDAVPRMHIQAFTAIEIAFFSKISGFSIAKVLDRLKVAGLGSLPGGGAEIFAPNIRRKLCPKKASAKTWLEVHKLAHKLGIHSNATMLYGHLESTEDRVRHLLALRDLQDETGGFLAFIPLPFHPLNTQFDKLHRTTAFDDLRTFAASRIILDNFPHMKAFWIMLGVKVAQITQFFGADDLDGTVKEEKITHAAGAVTPESLTKTEIIGLIRTANRLPVERNTLYEVVKKYG